MTTFTVLSTVGEGISLVALMVAASWLPHLVARAAAWLLTPPWDRETPGPVQTPAIGPPVPSWLVMP